MSSVEEQVRQFVREGWVPVTTQPGLVERVDQELRARRRRSRTATGLALGVAVIALLAWLVPQGRDAAGDVRPSEVAVEPTQDASSTAPSDCTAVSLLAAATATTPDADGARGLGLVLENDSPDDDGCTLGPGANIRLSAGGVGVEVVVPETFAALTLQGAATTAALRLTWANWCGDVAPTVAVRLHDGSTTSIQLPSGASAPDCVNPAEGSRLVVDRLEVAIVRGGGVTPKALASDFSNRSPRFLDGREGRTVSPEVTSCLPHGDTLESPKLDPTSCGLEPNAKPNGIGTAPPPADLVRACHADIESRPDCGVVLAAADGSLKPGQYTDEELRAAVEAAGYEWAPSE